MRNILIQSERFELRSLKKDDASERYLDWLNQGGNVYIEYSSQKRSIEEIRSYIGEREDLDTVLFLGVFLPETGEHIGNIKFEPIDYHKKIATMGILIGESDWRGKGVAPEVIKASSAWLKEMYNIKRIELGVDAGNLNAIKAYEKIGFLLDKASHNRVGNQNSLFMFWHID